jgi:hypothetical protein
VTAVARTRSGALIAVPAGVLAGLVAVIGAETKPLYALIGLAAIGGGALCVMRPIWAIYLAILMIPFEAAATARSGQVGITPSEVLFVGAAVGWVIRKLMDGGGIPRSPIIAPMVVTLAAHIPLLLLAANPFAVFKQLFMWSCLFILLLAILSDRDKRTTVRLGMAIGAAGGMVAAIAIYKQFGTAQVALDAGGIVTNRAVGPFASPVLLGTFVMLTVPVQFVFLLRGATPLIRTVALATLTLSVAALALALSRSAIVSLSAAVLWVVIWWRPARKPALVAVMLLAALLLSRFNPAPNLFDPNVIGERLSSITSPDTHTAQLRFRIWKKTPEIFMDNFPFGIGPKNLPNRAAEYDLLYNVGAPSNAHNTLLIFGTELGLPGLIVLFWLVFAIGRMVARAMKYADEPDRSLAIALSATFLALVVDGITGYSYGANAFALVAMMLVAMTARIDYGARQRAAQALPAAEPEPGPAPFPGRPVPAEPAAEREPALV